MPDRVVRSFALLALVLGFPAVALGGAYAGHHCPHHDSLPAERQASSHAGHSGHAAHGQEVVADEPDTSGHEHGGPCTCIGQCVTQVGVALPSPALVAGAVVVPATLTRVTAAASTWIVIDPPYLHPYANAPPSQG